MDNQPKPFDYSVSGATRSIVADVLKLPLADLRVEPVSGGYSRNRRSLVGHDNKWAFVKEVDVDLLPSDGEEELWWLRKDYLCIEKLKPFVSELLADWAQLEADGRTLIMTSYRAADGWLWQPPEDSESRTRYINAVIDATKKLESLHFDDSIIEELKFQPYIRDKLALDSGFAAIIESEAVRSQLKDKYKTLIANNPTPDLQQAYERMIAMLDDEAQLEALSERATQLANQPNDCFGHCDVRSDNIAFHPATGQLKLVDWNWASFTSQKFGATEFLIDMALRGVDVNPWANELNPELLAAIVGTYLRSSLKDPLIAGETSLRDMQAQSAAVALDMYKMAGNYLNDR